MFCIDHTHRAPLPTSQCLVGMLYIFVGSEEAPVSRGRKRLLVALFLFLSSGLCVHVCVFTVWGDAQVFVCMCKEA